MSWFEDSNIKKSYIVQTVSDVGIFSACTQVYLTNISPCVGDTINITGNLGVSGNISGTTYFGDGSQLSGIVTTDNFVTGGVYSASSETLYFTGTTGFTPFSVDVSALLDDTNNYVTGGTYNSSTDIVTLTRNDNVNINITGVSNTFTTGATYNEGTELITFVRNDGNSYTADLAAIVSATTNSFTTGATLNGNIIEFANSVLGLDYYNVDLTPIVSGATNGYTTGATLNGNIIEFANNLLGLDYYNVDLTSLVSGFTTGNTLQEVLDNGSVATGLNSNIDIQSQNSSGFGFETRNNLSGADFGRSFGNILLNGFEFYSAGGTNNGDYSSTIFANATSLYLNMDENSSTRQSRLDLRKTRAEFYHNNSSGDTQRIKFGELSLGNSQMLVTDDVNLKGLEYKADYSSNFTNESLITKRYVDNSVSGKVATTLFNTYTGDTETIIDGKLDTTLFNTYSGSVQTDLDGKVVTTLFNTYTGDTETALGTKLPTTTFNSYTGSVVDVFVSSGNANAVTQQLSLTNTTGGTFNVTNSAALFSDNDINVTGGTYDTNTGCVTFITNSGTTFDVCGFVTGITDTFVTGGTLTGENLVLKRNSGVDVGNIDLSGLVSGKLEISLFDTYTGDTETALGNKTDNTNFVSHTGDTTIHYTKGSINLSELGSSAHTHSISEVVNLQTNLDAKVSTTLFNTYTGDTETNLGNKVSTTLFNTYTGDTETSLGTKVSTASNIGGGEGLFSGKSGNDLQFKSLTSTGGTVTISTTGASVNLESAGGSPWVDNGSSIVYSGHGDYVEFKDSYLQIATTNTSNTLGTFSEQVLYLGTGITAASGAGSVGRTLIAGANHTIAATSNVNDSIIAGKSLTVASADRSIVMGESVNVGDVNNSFVGGNTVNGASGSLTRSFVFNAGSTTTLNDTSTGLILIGSSAFGFKGDNMVGIGGDHYSTDASLSKHYAFGDRIRAKESRQTIIGMGTDSGTMMQLGASASNGVHMGVASTKPSFGLVKATAKSLTGSATETTGLAYLGTGLPVALNVANTGDGAFWIENVDTSPSATVANAGALYNNSGAITWWDGTTNYNLTSTGTDVYVSSGNANAGTQQLSFTNTTGGTFNVTNAAALFSDNDVNVTGGTYNASTGCVTFTTNSATTFDVCGFVTGLTDTFVTGGTLSGDNLVLKRNSGVDVGNIDLSGLKVWTENGSDIYYNTGNVGIGTTVPQEKLHISTGNNVDSGNIEFLIGGTAGTNARTGRIIKNTSSPYEMTIRSSDFATGGNLLLNDTGGNVGIGKTSPTESLDISGNTVMSGTLNIGTIGGTTSVTNLGVDASGNIVSGTTGASEIGELSDAIYLSTNENLGLGDGALVSVTTSVGDQRNVAVGNDAGNKWSGGYSVFIGSKAGDNAVTGNYNVAIGADALGNAASCNTSIAIGSSALLSSTGVGNIGIGNSAGSSITSGGRNIFIGRNANGLNTNSYQIAIGDLSTTQASSLALGRSGQILLHGEFATAGRTKLGVNLGNTYSAPTANLQVKGNASDTTTFLVENGSGDSILQVDVDGNVGIGTATPSSILDIEGTKGKLKLRLDDENGVSNAVNQLFLTSEEATYTNYISIGTSQPSAELQFGMIGPSSTSTKVGSTGDTFIVATSAADNMNFINNEGTGTSDNIAFYAGKAVNDVLSSVTPDIIILGDGANIGNVGIGTATPTEKLEVNGNAKVGGTLNIGSIGGTTSITNLGVDSSGNVVSGSTISNTTVVSTYKIDSNADVTLYSDSEISITWDVSQTDIDMEILTDPTTSQVHVTKTKDGNDTTFDLENSDGVAQIEGAMGTDDKIDIVAYAPSDNTYPHYRIKIVRSNSLNYTNSPFLVIVEKWTSYD